MHSEKKQASIAANEHAEADSKKVLWFFIGFFGNILGILIAYMYQQTFLVSRFLGESPEYIAFYTDTYKEKTRKLQVRWAIIGAFSPLVFFIVLVLMTSLFLPIFMIEF